MDSHSDDSHSDVFMLVKSSVNKDKCSPTSTSGAQVYICPVDSVQIALREQYQQGLNVNTDTLKKEDVPVPPTLSTAFPFPFNFRLGARLPVVFPPGVPSHAYSHAAELKAPTGYYIGMGPFDPATNPHGLSVEFENPSGIYCGCHPIYYNDVGSRDDHKYDQLQTYLHIAGQTPAGQPPATVFVRVGGFCVPL